MKFTVTKRPFVQAASQVSLAVSSQTTIPILTGIKITVSESGCSLIASDSDISIQANVTFDENDSDALRVSESGSVVLPARVFVDLVRKLPGDLVEIDVGRQHVTTIRSGRSEFQLNGMDPEEFPQLPLLQDEDAFSIPSRLLKRMIQQTSFAVSTSESRPVLTGVCWTLQDNTLQFVATDSHRLACSEVQVELLETAEFERTVVPGKSLSHLNKLLTDDDRLVDVAVTRNQLLVKTDNVLFYSRLLDGNYPDTSRIIPQTSKMTLVLKTKELLNAIDRAALLTKDGKNNVVKLTAKGDILEITANTPELGNVSETVHVGEFAGEPMNIAFNARYVMDAMRVLASETVRIEFMGEMAPFVIQPTDDERILHLVLPVRTY